MKSSMATGGMRLMLAQALLEGHENNIQDGISSNL